MLSNVFLKTLRDWRRAMLWWCIGLAAMALWVIVLYPTLGDSGMYEDLVEQLSSSYAAFIDAEDLGSPEGYLQSEVFFFMAPLLLMVLTVGFGGGTIVREEEQGTLDLLMSTPLARWRLVLEKAAAMVLIAVVAALALWLGLVIGAAIAGVDISLVRMLEASLSCVLLGLTFGALALALACITGKRGLSIGVAAGLGIVAFFLNGFGASIEMLEPYRILSPFYYYSAAQPLMNGLSLGHAGVLLGLIVLLLGAALIAFQRRDLVV
ncbi:MAG: ABC transporter permease [Dehalococcoidia bacterium]|nr:ABC transporter permease [Dehalococcoidia bacterium]